MIVKMKHVNIMGPMEDIDRVIDAYIIKHNIQLENAPKELVEISGLSPFTGENPYSAAFEKLAQIQKYLPNELSGQFIRSSEAKDVFRKMYSFIKETEIKIMELDSKISEINEIIKLLTMYKDIDYHFEQLLSFEYIKFRFGKMPINSFKQFENYLYDTPYAIFIESFRDDMYVWGIYFTPTQFREQADAMFSSLHFLRLYLPDTYEDISLTDDSTQEVITKLEAYLLELHREHDMYSNRTLLNSDLNKELVLNTIYTLKTNFYHYDCRKYAAKTKQDFYIFVGWMEEEEAKQFEQEITLDEKVLTLQENSFSSSVTPPPTKMKNPKIFKPYELYVRMYGVPAYNEIDPTIFIAITYSIFFGMMFGDVGQGLVLAIGGFLLYHFKKNTLAGIISIVGVTSTIFGFMYGSFFGFEDTIVKHIWISPIHDILTLLATAVALGTLTVVSSMLMNVCNAIKQKRVKHVLFSSNGIAGIAFYIMALASALITFTTGSAPTIMLFAIGILFVMILLQHPLTVAITGEKPHGEKTTIAMMVIETVMEMFETLLSYFTNTVSYVRVGGFTICHAGLMYAVLELSGAGTSDVNIIGLVLGNLAVMGLECLLVGIQVLRLTYYESFSRYYNGSGREFAPYKDSIKKLS